MNSSLEKRTFKNIITSIGDIGTAISLYAMTFFCLATEESEQRRGPAHASLKQYNGYLMKGMGQIFQSKNLFRKGNLEIHQGKKDERRLITRRY